MFTPKKKLSFRENINMIVYQLETALDKLRRNSEGLKRRDGRVFDKCIAAQFNNKYKRAILYANECAEIRKLAKLILSSELALEQAIVRLQTVSELSDVMEAIAPIVGIVQETKGRLTGIIPSVAGKLDDVTSMLHNSMEEMGSVYTSASSSRDSNKEAKKILEEANAAAEETIREKFPELPQELHTAEEAEARIPVALTATGGDPSTYDQTLKRQVYNYIKAHEGKLSVIQCASYLGVFPTDVEKAILKLKEEGKITLE